MGSQDLVRTDQPPPTTVRARLLQPAAEPQGEFTKFLELPLELQRLIWEACLPRRIIRDWELSFDPRKSASAEGGQVQQQQQQCALLATIRLNRSPFRVPQIRPPPAIAQVCREARAVARRDGLYLHRGQLRPPDDRVRELDSWVDVRRDAFLVTCWESRTWARWRGCPTPAVRTVALPFERLETCATITTTGTATDGDTDADGHGDGCMVPLLHRACPFFKWRHTTILVSEIIELPDEVFDLFSGYDGFDGGAVFLDPPPEEGPPPLPIPLDYLVQKKTAREIRIRTEDIWLDYCKRTNPMDPEDWRTEYLVDGRKIPGILERYDRKHPWTRTALEALVEFDVKCLLIASSTQGPESDDDEDDDYPGSLET